MKNKNFELKFNLSNRAIYTLITLGIIALLCVGVYAIAGEVPNPGHSINQIECNEDFCVNDGKLGIGTEDPSSKLNVIGDALIDGNLIVEGEINSLKFGNTKVVEIGGWDMNKIGAKSVKHGISDFTKIASVTGIVFIDGKQYGYIIGDISDRTESDTRVTINNINSNFITLQAGNYPKSSPAWNDASFNRGYLYITYVN